MIRAVVVAPDRSTTIDDAPRAIIATEILTRRTALKNVVTLCGARVIYSETSGVGCRPTPVLIEIEG